jgi:hypothetical protein
MGFDSSTEPISLRKMAVNKVHETFRINRPTAASSNQNISCGFVK